MIIAARNSQGAPDVELYDNGYHKNINLDAPYTLIFVFFLFLQAFPHLDTGKLEKRYKLGNYYRNHKWH